MVTLLFMDERMIIERLRLDSIPSLHYALMSGKDDRRAYRLKSSNRGSFVRVRMHTSKWSGLVMILSLYRSRRRHPTNAATQLGKRRKSNDIPGPHSGQKSSIPCTNGGPTLTLRRPDSIYRLRDLRLAGLKDFALPTS